jgi:Fe-S-cluster containining protein
MNEILDRYAVLLQEVDDWFAGCVERHSALIACHHGCSECCRGLFDITLLDALFLKRGFDRLAPEVQETLQIKAAGRLDALSRQWPEFIRPWTLNHIREELWDEIMPEDDESPCPVLSEQGACLLYSHRPMTCRLNGIPMIDVSGEKLFDEWCSLNFVDCDPASLEDLRYPFNELFTQELLLFRELMTRLFGRGFNELDTIIPAALFLDGETVALIRPPHNSEAD